jgi:hypothetical protein
MQVSRRDAMMLAGAATAAASAAPARALSAPGMIAPDDEAGWARIGALYPSMAGPVTQLEHGYWGNMANQVAEIHKANVERLNRETSIYARRAMRKDQAVVKARAAQAMGVQPEEVGFCRNAAEGLQALISQFTAVGEGDAILWSDSDYDTSHAAMGSLRTKLRPVVWIEHGVRRIVVGGDCLVWCALVLSIAARQVWQSLVGQVSQHLCFGGHLAWPAHLCGFLPIRDPVNRGLV